MNTAINLHLFAPANIILFLLVSIRFAGLMSSAQFIKAMPVPMLIRAGFPFACSLLIFSFLSFSVDAETLTMWTVAWMGIQEFIIGAIMGLSVNMMTDTVQFAGHLVSTQMGLETTEMVDPTSQNPTPITGRFYNLLGMLLFFTMGMHRIIIAALAKTFDWLPPGQGFSALPNFTQHIAERMMFSSSNMFSQALSLALPIFGALLVLEIAIALISRTVPQMNIFMIAMPLKVIVGFGLIFITLPSLGHNIVISFSHFSEQIPLLLKP